MTQAPEELTRQHVARLREFRRFSSYGEPALGLPLDGPLDEHLAEHGFLESGTWCGGWVLSQQGWQELERRARGEAIRRKPHHDLARRVARWLERQGRLAWLNRSFEVSTRNDHRAVRHLGLMPSPDFPDDGFLGPLRCITRPDVISVAPAERRSELQPWVFEVKVSRHDFYVDIDNPHKRLAYALLAERVYYACPKGLIAVDEVPVGCGLVVETRKGFFQVASEAPRCKTRHSAHLNSLLRGVPGTVPATRTTEHGRHARSAA